MKYYTLLLCIIFFYSCQKEEFTVVQDQEDTEEVTNASANLRLKLRSVSSHDGSFDDIIDDAPCVSIKIPYTIFFNGEPYNVGTILDLRPIGEDDEVALIYPVTLTRSDRSEVVVQGNAEWQNERDVCAEDPLSREHNACVDIAFPITLALYNLDETEFETREIGNSEALFPWVVDPQSEDLISINYPIDLIVAGGSALRITNNTQLADTIDALQNSCE